MSGSITSGRRRPLAGRSRFLVCLAFLCTVSAIASGQKYWTRAIGGDHNEEAWSLVERSARDGFVLTGWSTSWGPGGQDYYNPFVMRIDESGDVVWKKGLGKQFHEFAYSIVETKPDRGYAVCATRTIQGANDDIVLYRMNGEGELLWQCRYGDPWMQFAHCIRQIRTGFVVAGARGYAGMSYADAYVMWLSEAGDTLRTRTYGGEWADWAESIEPAPEGGVVFAGNTYSFGAGEIDYWIVKTDADGNILWSRTYGTSRPEMLSELRAVRGNGYVAVGTAYEPGENQTDILIVRLSEDGDVLWAEYLGSSAGDVGTSVSVTADGDFVICGYTVSVGPYQSLYLMRVDSAGTLEWTRTYGGGGSDLGYAVEVTSDGGILAAGTTSSTGPGSQIYIVRTNQDGLQADALGLAGADLATPSVRLCPNPFRASTSALGREAESFWVLDASGRRIAQSGGERIGTDLAPGVYFLLPRSGASRAPIRIVKLP